jgi:hypothetical protein
MIDFLDMLDSAFIYFLFEEYAISWHGTVDASQIKVQKSGKAGCTIQ